jgi:hypothetical protein
MLRTAWARESKTIRRCLALFVFVRLRAQSQLRAQHAALLRYNLYGVDREWGETPKVGLKLDAARRRGSRLPR